MSVVLPRRSAGVVRRKAYRRCITDRLRLISRRFVPPKDVFAILEQFRGWHPNHRTALIHLAPLGSTGEPGRYWPEIIHAYVMSDSHPWQIVLAVEQFLYGSISVRADK